MMKDGRLKKNGEHLLPARKISPVENLTIKQKIETWYTLG